MTGWHDTMKVYTGDGFTKPAEITFRHGGDPRVLPIRHTIERMHGVAFKVLGKEYFIGVLRTSRTAN
jgi:hypothetical protein